MGTIQHFRPELRKSEPYFPQTAEWSHFWSQVSGHNHTILYFEEHILGITVTAYIYEYPWYGSKMFGWRFWHIPAGAVLSELPENNEQLKTILNEFQQRISEKAKTSGSPHKIVFWKWDLAYDIAQQLDLKTPNDFKSLLTESSLVEVSDKSLLYNQAMIIDMSKLNWSSQNGTETKELSLQNLNLFWEENRDFWLTVSDTIRNSTKRSLKQKWQIELVIGGDKLESWRRQELAEQFWNMLQISAGRQGFATHDVAYFAEFLKQDFSRIMLLRDEQGEVQAGWLGVSLGDRILHLHGGNSPISFKKFGQNILHLAGFYLAKQEGKAWYDMGGYEPGTGAAKFKDAYRGNVIYFPGPLDFIMMPLVYKSIIFLITRIKLVRSKMS